MRTAIDGGFLALVGAALLVWVCAACAPFHPRPYPRIARPRCVIVTGSHFCRATVDLRVYKAPAVPPMETARAGGRP